MAQDILTVRSAQIAPTDLPSSSNRNRRGPQPKPPSPSRATLVAARDGDPAPVGHRRSALLAPTHAPRAKTDERVYLHAFEAASRGESPYDSPNSEGLWFYYPPTFAAVGAAALEHLGKSPLLVLLRILNLLGLCGCLWCAFLFAPLRWQWCLLLSASYVALKPPALIHGLNSGNMSLAVVGASLVALTTWPSRPIAAGLLLGLATVTKPITPAALATLAAYRSDRRRTAHLLVALSGIAVVLALLAISPFLRDYLQSDVDVDAWPLRRSVSLYRWLSLLGVPIQPLVLVLFVCAVSACLAWRQPADQRRIFIVAVVAMTLATPAHWSHTLLIMLPLEVLALATAWSRWKANGDSSGPVRRWEPLLIVTAVAALQLVDGIGGAWRSLPYPFRSQAWPFRSGRPSASASIFGTRRVLHRRPARDGLVRAAPFRQTDRPRPLYRSLRSITFSASIAGFGTVWTVPSGQVTARASIAAVSPRPKVTGSSTCEM